MHYQQIVTNFKPIVRNDKMQGKEWIVAPMVMMVEGVLNGNHGPIFYPFDEMSEIPAIWNHKPVVVYHPEQNGKALSACTPDELTVRSIGVIMNTEAKDGKLVAEAWLDPDRIEVVDNRISEAIENETTLELSTGLFMDVEEAEGDFNGVEYKGIARNFRPDHLAVLPDLEGACSVEDGAGFIRLNMRFVTNKKVFVENELSFEAIRSQLMKLVDDQINHQEYEWAYISDVFSDTFVYEHGNKLYEQGYKVEEEIVSLVGLPTEVIRVISYELVKNDTKGRNMEKEKIVDALIENEKTQWTEDDRESLMALNDEALAKMPPVESEETEEPDPVQNAAKKGAEDIEPGKPVEKKIKVQTVNEYIKTLDAPKEIVEVLEHGVATYNENRKALVEKIVANEKNTFSKEYLESKDIKELEAIAKLCEPVVNEDADDRFDFSGQGPVSNVSSDEEPLTLPTTVSS